MGKDLYENFPKAREIFEHANALLGERFSDFLFSATETTESVSSGTVMTDMAIKMTGAIVNVDGGYTAR